CARSGVSYGSSYVGYAMDYW
nr:immunoglobulin heavy chain junction region [Mus musculus]MBK4197246.1 immunoglobulin heavy chain junction region [Mus musculus]